MGCDRIGLVKTSLIDYPGEVAAVFFLPGCNFRCPYCHNPELVGPPFPEDLLSREEIHKFLDKRKNVLGGVSITGGEPLMHLDLPEFIEEVRRYGLKIKLDTNGSFPDRLEPDRYDYVAMDVKTALGKYGLVGGTNEHLREEKPAEAVTASVTSSIEKIISSGVPHEFRTTVVPGIVTAEDIREITGLIRGAEKYVLTGFRPGKTLAPDFDARPYSHQEMEAMLAAAAESGIPCSLRISSQ